MSLDVGTANSLVLHRLAMKSTTREDINIVEYKKKLVSSLLGTRIHDIAAPIHTQHVLQRDDKSRHNCVYSSWNGNVKRTRYICIGENCNLPLCSVGTGKADQDCFALSHASVQILVITKKRHEAMLQKKRSISKKIIDNSKRIIPLYLFLCIRKINSNFLMRNCSRISSSMLS